MPTVPHIIHMRQRRRKKYQNTPSQRTALGLATLVSLSVLIVFFGLASFYTALTRNLPSLESLPLLLDPPNGLMLQPTRFYDRSGEHVIHSLQNPAVSERHYIPLNQTSENTETDEFLAPTLVTATIAIADPTFWSNPGYTPQGIRLDSIHQNEHNTLAQRLVSDLLLWDETPSVWRALRERLLAAQITNHYGREKVMEWYLNSAYYGNLAYGADAAAQIYLGKSASQLNLAESALLAAVAEFPALNPLDAPRTSLERGKVVIDVMLGQGLITEEEAAEARNTKLTFREAVAPEYNLAPSFINLAWEGLSPTIPLDRLERGGFEIITSLDYDLQLQASCAAEVHLARLRGEQSTTNAADGTPCQASLLLPTLTFEGGTSFHGLAANVVVFDPSSGQILAMVGESTPGADPAHLPGHSPGSLLTPFIYLTAFTRGFSPASLVWDIPQNVPGIPTEGITPNGGFRGPIRLRDALANDYLIPAIQIMNQIGAENVLQTARQLGLTSLVFDFSVQATNGCPGCPLLFGGGEITLLEAVQAFGAFTNQGLLVGRSADGVAQNDLQPLRPITVLRVSDSSGRVWMTDQQVKTRPVISTQLAYLMTHTLSDEVARWPSLSHPNPLEIGRPAGAKMGQTVDGNDVWTVGFTPQVVVGVWMGNRASDSFEEGSVPPKVAAALWHAIIQYVTHNQPAATWSIPPGISTLDVCDPSGMLPTLQCPTIVSEVFLSGQEPTQPDTLYQAYQINRETGRLATVFTPPELIEERIYLNVPLEASAWAQSVGVQTPPETYDVIYTPPTLPDAQITFPQMFGHLKGEVTIRGSASGADFESYRLQVGQGLNPSGWVVIQDDSTTPVENGALGTWDTSGLNGLYALQLVVLRSDRRVNTTTIQVTVDNLPPDVSIPYPEDGQTFTSASNKTITFQVQASDDSGLEAVEFYIDNRLITTQTQPPFAFPWQSTPGKYTLQVKAIDLSGNASAATVSFKVEP